MIAQPVRYSLWELESDFLHPHKKAGRTLVIPGPGRQRREEAELTGQLVSPNWWVLGLSETPCLTNKTRAPEKWHPRLTSVLHLYVHTCRYS